MEKQPAKKAAAAKAEIELSEEDLRRRDESEEDYTLSSYKGASKGDRRVNIMSQAKIGEQGIGMSASGTTNGSASTYTPPSQV
jgi:hypothetical protein